MNNDRVREKVEKLLAQEEARTKRTWAYYQELKNSNPSEYWKPKTQTQMIEDAEELGERFKFDD